MLVLDYIMNGKNTVICICCILVFSSCEDIFFQENTTSSPTENFDALWEGFDLNYAYFEYKNIRWDSVYDVYRPKINENTGNQELFETLAEMINLLEDGHVDLTTPFDRSSFDFHDSPAPTINWIGGEALSDYLSNIRNVDNTLFYSRIRNHNIGYIWINSFGGEEETYKAIDDAIDDLANTDGMIIDLRMNGGGSDSNSEVIVSRFTEEKLFYRRVRYRDGPEHDDFTRWFDDHVEPASNNYLKQIIVLVNRFCFSATESCLLALDELHHVTLVGDTTGGGSGNPIYRELPNGWIYRLSNWQEVDVEMNYVEGVGIAPDSLVWISRSDSINGVDVILETGINMIEK